MSTQTPLPTVDGLKTQAKRLREKLHASGTDISHCNALELIAHQFGARDWNTLHASAATQSHVRTAADGSVADLRIGQAVTGRYIGQPFTGKVIGMHALAIQGRYRVTLKFDKPVDVVTFSSFSAFRQRVTSTIDEGGRTLTHTSNGEPHLQLDL